MKMRTTLPLLAFFMIGFAASTVQAAPPPEAQAEFTAFETRFQTFADTFNTGTAIEDLTKALGDFSVATDQPCSSYCVRVYDVEVGKATPFQIKLWQLSNSFNSSNYHYDRPFEPEFAKLTVVAKPEMPAGLCFSTSSWNDALVKQGWEPLAPYSLTRQIRQLDGSQKHNRPDFDKAAEVDVPVTGYATRRGKMYLTLSTTPEAYLNYYLSPEDIKAMLDRGDCLGAVVIDEKSAKVGYDAAHKAP